MKALFYGSFDPFTDGHYNILKQAEQLFDEVVVVIARNPKKKRRFTVESCMNAIQSICNSQVIYTDDILPTFLAQQLKCDYIVRGLRNTSDYLYEEEIILTESEINKSIRTIYLRSGNHISSSLVYGLYEQGYNVDKYLPYSLSLLNNDFN